MGTLIGKTLDVDLLALRRRNVIRIKVAMRDVGMFATRVVKSDVFLLLKGYTFRFDKEGNDYVPEPDFAPFMWRRDDKEDDANGMDEEVRRQKYYSLRSILLVTDLDKMCHLCGLYIVMTHIWIRGST